MKWLHYYEHFDQWFPPNPQKVLEIGVNRGDGLQYLRRKFPNAEIYGLDYIWTKQSWHLADDLKVQQLAGDQSTYFENKKIPFDLVLDDGGHRPYQQLGSFKHIFPDMPDGGVYIIEDYHMNYRPHWHLYGQFWGIRRHLEKMIFDMNKWHRDDEPVERSPVSITFAPQLVIIKKGVVKVQLEDEKIL